MVPVTSLLKAIERKEVAALNDLIEHDGIAEAHCTHEEAVALWEEGWQAGEEWSEFHHVSWGGENERRAPPGQPDYSTALAHHAGSVLTPAPRQVP